MTFSSKKQRELSCGPNNKSTSIQLKKNIRIDSGQILRQSFYKSALHIYFLNVFGRSYIFFCETYARAVNDTRIVFKIHATRPSRRVRRYDVKRIAEPFDRCLYFLNYQHFQTIIRVDWD